MKRKLLTGAALMASVFAMNAQDVCATALELPEGVTTVEEIYGEYIPESCWNIPTSGTDADAANWYYVVAPANGVYRINTNLSQNGANGTSDDTRVSVYSGTCDDLSCWSASDDVYAANTAADIYLTDFEFPVVAGTTYYVAFDNKWNADGFDVELTFIASDCSDTSVPFSESWTPTTDYWFCWAKEDLNQDDNGFQLLTDYNFGGENGILPDNAVAIFSNEFDLDDYLIAPVKDLTAGVSYTLSLTYSGVNASATSPANESFEAVVLSDTEIIPLGSESDIVAGSTSLAGILATATTNTYEFTPDADGEYSFAVHATSLAGGGVLAFFNIAVTETASTGKADANAFSVFPNPANSVVNIANAKAQISDVKLTDINGRTVKAASFDGVTNAQVNISDLSAGVYMMTINSDKGAVTKKIVKN